MKRNIIIILILAITAAVTSAVFQKLDQADIAYAQGLRFSENRMYSAAVPYFQKAFELRPNFQQAIRELGLSALWSGNYELAEMSFKKLLKRNPDDSLAERGLADILAYTGRRSEAIVQYEKILQKNPNDLTTMKSLADLFYWEKDYVNAIPLYDKFLLQEPTHQESIVNLADCLNKTGEKEKAKGLFETLEQRYPNYIPALKAIARYHLENKDCTEAEVYYRRVLAEDQSDIEAISRLADCLTNQNNFGEAAKVADEAVVLHPDDQALLLTRANIYLWAKKYQDAQKYFKEYLVKYPDDPNAIKGLNEARLWPADEVRKEIDAAIKQKRFSEAERSMRNYLKANKNDKKMREKLGDMLLSQGKFSEAEVEYKKIVGK